MPGIEGFFSQNSDLKFRIIPDIYSDAYILECMKKDLKIWNGSQKDIKNKQKNERNGTTEFERQQYWIMRRKKSSLEKI